MLNGSRGILAAMVCAGALASASLAEETNWDALESSDWSGAAGGQAGGQAGEQAAGEQAAGAGNAGQGDVGAAIQAAFVDLGMAEPRAECYGKVLVENLSPEGQQEAAELVQQSATADDVKTNVISGGTEMVGGFSAADAACPEGMGG